MTNERGRGGRFLPGNKCGRGNPLAGRQEKLRAVLMKSVKASDFAAIYKMLLDDTKDEDPTVRHRAAEILLNRTLGKPVTPVLNANVESGQRDFTGMTTDDLEQMMIQALAERGLVKLPEPAPTITATVSEVIEAEVKPQEEPRPAATGPATSEQGEEYVLHPSGV